MPSGPEIKSRKDSTNSSHKGFRLHELLRRDIKGLLNLYGVEISACTGNARRITLIDVLFTPPLKYIFTSFPWKTATVRQAIMRIVGNRNADEFVKCYTENPGWQGDIDKAILAGFHFLKETGIDSEGNLVAICHGRDDVLIVEFPIELYSWGNILRDSGETFTVAVVTDTCLSSRSSRVGKRCENGAFNDEDSLALATQIAFTTPILASSRFSLSTNQSGEKYWVMRPGAADQTLKYVTESRETGNLKVLETISERRDDPSSQALTLRWHRTRPLHWENSFSKNLVAPTLI